MAVEADRVDNLPVEIANSIAMRCERGVGKRPKREAKKRRRPLSVCLCPQHSVLVRVSVVVGAGDACGNHDGGDVQVCQCVYLTEKVKCA